MVQDTLAGVTNPHDAEHHGQVTATPWAGVHGTRIHSARHYGRHWHDTLGIGWIEHGAQQSASGRGPVEAQAGDLVSSNPGEVHDGRPIGGGARRWQMLYFEPDAAVGWLASARRGDVELRRPVFQDPALRTALQQLFLRLGAWRAAPGDGTTALACDEALAAVGALLAPHAGTPRRPEPTGSTVPLASVRQRLADDLLNPPALAELAALAGCSRYQLLRRFQQAHGLPPHAWLLQQRLERARRLISAGLGLAQAAADSGFADQSHLTRHFTRQFGYTPGAWRTAVAATGLQPLQRPLPALQ